jgi:hypothetical protein
MTMRYLNPSDGARSPRWLRGIPALALGLALCTHTAAQAQPASAATPSEDVRTLHAWVLKTADHAGGPFVVIDKRQARVWVYDRRGRAVGNAAVLLGSARGDDSVPGIGERPMNQIRPHERTTPAGRFHLEPGVNLKGEDIFWVDYDAAVSLHRVRPTNPKERRLQRLASPTPADNRISYGCINVPTAFYDGTIRPLFSAGKGWIYVLPETRPVQTLFNTVGAQRTDPLKPAGRAG